MQVLKGLRSKLLRETAASFTEYAVALAILIVVFIVAGIALNNAASTRGSFAMQSGTVSVPCATGPLQSYAAGNADACK